MKPEGVLPKSLPIAVNNYLDDWMFEQIKQQINLLQTHGKVSILDLGCGYGRLSKRILNEFPNTFTFGIDVAKHYVDLYNKDLAPRGKAQVGDIRKLPFKDNYFDVVFIVTTLMYLEEKSDQQKAVEELLRVLKPNGKFIFIERNPDGHKVMTLGGILTLIRGKSNQEITSVSFKPEYLNHLIRNYGGKNIKNSGIPLLTFSIPFLVAISFIFKTIIKPMLNIVKVIDRPLSSLLTLSLYVSYTGEKSSTKKY